MSFPGFLHITVWCSWKGWEAGPAYFRFCFEPDPKHTWHCDPPTALSAAPSPTDDLHIEVRLKSDLKKLQGIDELTLILAISPKSVLISFSVVIHKAREWLLRQFLAAPISLFS